MQNAFDPEVREYWGQRGLLHKEIQRLRSSRKRLREDFYALAGCARHCATTIYSAGSAVQPRRQQGVTTLWMVKSAISQGFCCRTVQGRILMSQHNETSDEQRHDDADVRSHPHLQINEISSVWARGNAAQFSNFSGFLDMARTVDTERLQNHRSAGRLHSIIASWWSWWSKQNAYASRSDRLLAEACIQGKPSL